MKSSDVDPRNGTSPNGIPLLTSHLHGQRLSPARPSRWDGEKADLQPGEQATGTREEKPPQLRGFRETSDLPSPKHIGMNDC
jgi:hypothetical protein